MGVSVSLRRLAQTLALALALSPVSLSLLPAALSVAVSAAPSRLSRPAGSAGSAGPAGFVWDLNVDNSAFDSPHSDSSLGQSPQPLAPLRFDGHELWLAQTTSPGHLSLIRDLEESHLVDIWGSIVRGRPALFRVAPAAAAEVRAALARHGIPFSVAVRNVQALVDEEMQRGDFEMDYDADNDLSVDDSSPSDRKPYPDLDDNDVAPGHGGQAVLLPSTPSTAGSTRRTSGASASPYFTKYHDIKDIREYYDALVTKYPDLVEPFSIGKTYEGREIFGIHIHANAARGSPRHRRRSSSSSSSSSVNATVPQMLFHGGMHAREWIAPAVVTYLATELLDRYGKDETVTTLLQSFKFSIIPVLNVDGYVYTHTKDRMWRKNRQPNRGGFCVGTDPNRNWAYKWGTGGSSTNPCSDAYMGPSAFSAPESLAMAQYVQSQAPNVLTYIDFHAFSQLWMYPYGAVCDELPVGHEAMDRVGKAGAKALKAVHKTSFQVGPICDVIYQASGSSVDHVYAYSNVSYPFAIELRDTGRYGFILPPKFIVPSGEEMYDGIIAMSLQIAKEQGMQGFV
ncbi:hypothetical protein BC831DRAFT_436652 [Entophlyctis helioformis]|nr:hypothetical protein BC831DRAFT_436652 [Entophlyctis helioformis]